MVRAMKRFAIFDEGILKNEVYEIVLVLYGGIAASCLRMQV